MRIAVAVAVVWACSLPARADVQLSSPEIVVSSTGLDQRQPVVASDASGSYRVVVWQRFSAVTGWDVYGRLYDHLGQPKAAEFAISATTSCERAPAVSMDAAGNFVVAWESDGVGFHSDILARRFNSAGVALGNVTIVNTILEERQQRPSVASAPDGRFAVTWQSFTQDPSTWNVAVRFFSAAGAPTYPFELPAHVSSAGSQHSPVIAYVAYPAQDPNGFRIVWEKDGAIYGRSFHVPGSTNDLVDTLMVASPTHWHSAPSLASDSSGNLVITTEAASKANPADRRVAFQRWRGSFAFGTPAFVDLQGPVGRQLGVVAALRGDGDFALGWASDNADGSARGISMKHFGNRQQPLGTSAGANQTLAGDQENPNVASSTGGSLLVAWDSALPSTTQSLIAARLVKMAPLRFYTVLPCRALDTRDPAGPQGGPSLSPNVQRRVYLLPVCGVPATARSVSINVTVLPSADGSLKLDPGDGAPTDATVISFRANAPRANNAIRNVALNGDGSISLVSTSAQPLHAILDINGYFE